MTSRAQFVCRYCGKNDFARESGLQQHLNRARKCSLLHRQEQIGILMPSDPALHARNQAEDIPVFDTVVRASNRSVATIVKKKEHTEHVAAAQEMDDGDQGFPEPEVLSSSNEANDTDSDKATSDSNTGEFGAKVASSSDDDSDDNSEVSNEPSREWLDNYLDWEHRANKTWEKFTEDEVNAILLMDTLRRKRATLDTYDEVMTWHLRTSKLIAKHETAGQYKRYISRKKMIQRLIKRYYVRPNLFQVKWVSLPISGAKVELIMHDARDMMVDLLIDPRFSDEDYLHFDNDPFAAPPEEWSTLADINTGRSYRETYKKLITGPNQLLVPILLYIDGATTGQFGNLPIEALKICPGILNAKARDKPYAWRVLGYVPHYHKSKTKGKEIVIESGHDIRFYTQMEDNESDGEIDMNVEQELVEKDENESTLGTNTVATWDEFDVDKDTHSAQDWHYILSHFMASYRKMEQDHMVWNLRWGDKVYENVTLKFFVCFFKSDNDEADKLCGHYTSRSGNVKNLCRYCTCPTTQTGWVYGEQHAKKKTEAMIKGNVDKKNLAKLRELSQRYLNNAFHGIRFGQHDNGQAGIHGACPSDMLHQVLLGIDKYVILGLMEQIGKKSQQMDAINGLAKQYGKEFAHNSDRNLPKTTFRNGIFEGKIMGKEYPGVLLVCLTVLHSAYGKRTLRKNGKFYYQQPVQDRPVDAYLRDWIMVIELVLQWEEYLKSDVMQVKHVQRLKFKHRFLLYLLKKVLKRSTGMGFNLIKFHMLLHLSDCMLNDGVPNNVDTGSNEAHHKPTKYYAKLTQRDETKFEKQTAQREDEFHLLDLAMCEVIDGRAQWDYLDLHLERGTIQARTERAKRASADENQRTLKTGDTSWYAVRNEFGQPTWVFTNKMHNRKYKHQGMSAAVFSFVLEMQEILIEKGALPGGILPVYTMHKRDDQIFRATPNYKGTGAWFDWVIVDWARMGGRLPCQLWGFLDLEYLPDTFKVKFKENWITRGTFALVESANYLENDLGSDLFRPIEKDVARDNGGIITSRRLYLADVEAIVDTACVVPDIGHNNVVRFFQMTPKTEWPELFIKWIEAKYEEERDEMENIEGKDEYKLEEEMKPRIRRKRVVVAETKTKSKGRKRQRKGD